MVTLQELSNFLATQEFIFHDDFAIVGNFADTQPIPATFVVALHKTVVVVRTIKVLAEFGGNSMADDAMVISVVVVGSSSLSVKYAMGLVRRQSRAFNVIQEAWDLRFIWLFKMTLVIFH